MTILHTYAAATADPILDPFRFIFEVLFLHGVLFLFLFFLYTAFGIGCCHYYT